MKDRGIDVTLPSRTDTVISSPMSISHESVGSVIMKNTADGKIPALHREYDFAIALLVGPAVRRAQIARAILENREIFT